MAGSARKQNSEARSAVKAFRRRVILAVLIVACVYLSFNVVLVRWRLHKQQEQLEAVIEAIEVARQENDELVRVLNGGEEEVIELRGRRRAGLRGYLRDRLIAPENRHRGERQSAGAPFLFVPGAFPSGSGPWVEIQNLCAIILRL